MKNYPTSKTNVRLQASIIEAVKRRSLNFNGFCKDALSDYVRSISLCPHNYSDDLAYITHNSTQHTMKVGWTGEMKLVTMRLREIDLALLKLNGYDLSRTIRLALNYAIRNTPRLDK